VLSAIVYLEWWQYNNIWKMKEGGGRGNTGCVHRNWWTYCNRYV